MIRYALVCKGGHTFDSWFQSAEGYDSLARAGLLSCPVCGGREVEKALMAPAVRRADRDGEGPLTAPANLLEQALAELRRKLETESDYVGLSFAAEARAMHEGRVPERPIWGEARIEDARALLEDGVPVAPLPFLPRRSTN
jgi:hypothetical protein